MSWPVNHDEEEIVVRCTSDAGASAEDDVARLIAERDAARAELAAAHQWRVDAEAAAARLRRELDEARAASNSLLSHVILDVAAVRELIRSTLGEFKGWRCATAEAIPGQEEAVASDHNRLLAAVEYVAHWMYEPTKAPGFPKRNQGGVGGAS